MTEPSTTALTPKPPDTGSPSTTTAPERPGTGWALGGSAFPPPPTGLLRARVAAEAQGEGGQA
ncbi:hypothetical protein FH608_031615 [Nonomuraea phyllanthi]|uniref:Uncharacterized protein n=1 Tax=Nonomuraea phyllanthi TaxID=2219224 RepID=A0A5C4VIR6_9ACTN|nr:hypothetical protein [Nonomuraea phyllanthi]KAB8191155.1 hypothetical protein FH608_031615 [Nonomuraea phyllanthi]QFY12785.1 hypothetical protein GBF35_44990 [Nonomuraea phyllanthi]